MQNFLNKYVKIFIHSIDYIYNNDDDDLDQGILTAQIPLTLFIVTCPNKSSLVASPLDGI